MKKANKNKVEKFIGADRASERGAMGGSSTYSNSEYTNLILTILEFSI